MSWAIGDILGCITESCEEKLSLHNSASIWTARRRGWGVVETPTGLVVLCPIHAGRSREKRPALRAPLPGEVGLFELPTSATVEKKTKRKPKITS